MKNLITLTLTIAILISCNLSVFGAVNPLSKKKEGDNGKERFVLKNSGKTIEKLSSDKILPNKIHIKTKSKFNFDNKFSNNIQNYVPSLQTIGIKSIKQPFSNKTNINTQILSDDPVGLERIYEISFTSEIDVYLLCEELMKDPEIEYATPIYKRYVMEHTPNDPGYTLQYGLDKMQLPKAWEISKGSTNVLIAIIDSGTEITHEDLQANIWNNPNEIPNNGVDDDGNGKTDDYNGWDMVGNITYQQAVNEEWDESKDPTNSSMDHGTITAGCASGVTNNAIGIASPGYSCKLVPVKCASNVSGNTGIWRAYEAITYAANLGADIINCSWGGEGYSPAEQDIIDDAFNKGCLIVVSSGNDGLYLDASDVYPAGYNNVLCVGSSTSADAMSDFSNYGVKVHTYAPGTNIYSTSVDDSYTTQSGTSFSSPYVAGVAGLVLSVHPDWTPKQVMHQIRSTSDNVLTTSSDNRPILYGRTNAYNALLYNNTDENYKIPGIEAYSANIELSNYDSKDINFDLKNFLADASDVKITLSSMSGYFTISTPTYNIGSLSTNESKVLNSSIQLQKTCPWFKGKDFLLIKIESGSYVDYSLITIDINVTTTSTYNTIETISEYFIPTWQFAHSPKKNIVWAVGDGGIFGSTGGYYMANYSTTKWGNVSSEEVYCVYGFDAKTAFTGSGPSSGLAKIFKTTDAGENWTNTSVSPITKFVNDIHFFDEQNGILIGDPNSGNSWGIATTTNAGTNWMQIANCPTAATSETGWVGCVNWVGDHGAFGTNKGKIYITKDKGATWNYITVSSGSSTAATVHLISFIDESTAMCIYSESTADNSDRFVAFTTDGGTTWAVKGYDFTGNSLTPVYLYSHPGTKNFYILCTNGIILTTQDAQTWGFTYTQQHKYSIVGAGFTYTDSNNDRIRLWNFGPEIGYTDFMPTSLDVNKQLVTDPAVNVNYDTIQVSKSKLSTISMINKGNAIINISDYQFVFPTGADTTEFKIFGSKPTSVGIGQTSSIIVRFSPKSEGLKTAQFIIKSDSDQGDIALNLSGYATPNTGVYEYQSADGIVLEQNVPNPASNETRVNFTLPYSAYTELYITNMFGQKLTTEYAKFAEAGTKSIHISTNNLTNGIYYMNLKVGSKVIVRKFAVIK